VSLPRDVSPDPVEAARRAADDPLLASVVAAAEAAGITACPDAETIGLFAEHALNGTELRAVDAHVQRCARCRAIVAAWERGGVEAAPASGHARPAPGGVAGWLTGWRWLVPAASLAAVAVMAVWAGRPDDDGGVPVARQDVTAPASVPSQDAFVPEAPAATSGLARGAGARVAEAPAAAPVAGGSRTAKAEPGREAAANAGIARQEVAASTEAVAQSGIADARAVAPRQAEVAPQPAPPARESAATAAPTPAPIASAPAAAAVDARGSGRALGRAEDRAASDTVPVTSEPEAAAFRATLATPLWRARDGVVERTPDRGRTWQRMTVPDGLRIVAVAAPSAEICWAVTTDAVIRTTDGGASWTRTPRPGTEPLAGVTASSARVASVFGRSTARFDTTDGGVTWSAPR